jgi:hypothetical protein
MKATKISTNKWQVIDGLDIVCVWIDADGIKTARMSRKSSGDNFISHAPQNLPFSKLIDRAEGQLPL